MKEDKCTCNDSMMADHNAVCKACSEKVVSRVFTPPKTQPAKVKPRQRVKCTCDTRMMADHNAVCAACSES